MLILRPHETGFISGVAYQLFVSMAVALERAWMLISGGGLSRHIRRSDGEASGSTEQTLG